MTQTHKPDSVIQMEGIHILLKELGAVDAERFISLIIRNHFDYTKWRETLFDGMDVDTLAEKANLCSASLDK